MVLKDALIDSLQFGADGLLPAAITDHADGRLLVLCFLDREALARTVAEGRVHVFRRSQSRVQMKGARSGHIQTVREIRVNCDQNSLEIRVEQEVAACAHGYYSCYYRRWNDATGSWETFDERCFDPDTVYRSSSLPR